jgi:hypothetical protein
LRKVPVGRGVAVGTKVHTTVLGSASRCCIPEKSLLYVAKTARGRIRPVFRAGVSRRAARDI